MAKVLLVFFGSGAGGVLRYLLGGWVQRATGATFPWGTFTVNVSGCLVIGFLATAWMSSALVREEWRVAVLIGVLGGYTTFSSYSRETIAMVRDGEWMRALLYVAGSTVIGLAATWLGAALAGRLYGANTP